jgi:type VI secretion system protein ImpH
METRNRKKKRLLTNDLLENSRKYNFFELVRRLEQANCDLPKIGTSNKLEDNTIRFGQYPSLAFAPSSIHNYQIGKSGIDRLIINFFGLLGPNGPMPLYFTQYVHSRSMSYYDSALQEFLDIFHHRLISMFYRAWSLNELTVSYDRPEEDDLSFYLGCLLGMYSTPKRNKNFYSKLYWGGRFIGKNPNAEGLTKILSDFFNIPIRIKEFVGSYISIPKQFRLLLGRVPDNTTLGQNTVLGSKYYSLSDKFKIIVGALNLKEYKEILPNKKSYQLFKDWINRYITNPLTWEINCIVKAEEISPARLGNHSQLGFTTWLTSQSVKDDIQGVSLDADYIYHSYQEHYN